MDGLIELLSDNNVINEAETITVASDITWETANKLTLTTTDTTVNDTVITVSADITGAHGELEFIVADPSQVICSPRLDEKINEKAKRKACAAASAMIWTRTSASAAVDYLQTEL